MSTTPTDSPSSKSSGRRSVGSTLPLVQDEKNCSICLEEFKTNDTNDNNNNETKTLPCKHVFHKSCIDKWIELRNLCPLCRTRVDSSQPIRQLDTDDDLSIQLIQSIFETNPRQIGRNMFRSPFIQLLGGSFMNAFEVVDVNDMNNEWLYQSHHDPADDNDPEIQQMLNLLDVAREMERRANIQQETRTRIRTQQQQQQQSMENDQQQYQQQQSQHSQRRRHQYNRISRGRNNDIENEQKIRLGNRINNIILPLPQQHQQHQQQQQSTLPLPLQQQQQQQYDNVIEQAQCSQCAQIVPKSTSVLCPYCKTLRYCSDRCRLKHTQNHREWCVNHRPLLSFVQNVNQK